jgi:hypothetical protein
MRLTIVAVVVLICALWFVSRLYRNTKDAPKKDQIKSFGDNAQNSSEADSQE